MTIDEYRKLTKPKRNKYGNKRADGFDSQKEADRNDELLLLLRVGKIKNLQRQVHYELIPRQEKNGHKLRAAEYIADFVYTDAETGEQIVEDVKGYRGGEAYRVFMLKKKLMLERWGIWVNEV